MNKCDKRITAHSQLTLQKETWTCGKQVYKGTFCKKHWDRRVRKMQLYGERKGYKEPTSNEMKSGKTLYLKTKPSYGGHRYRGGFIYVGGITPTSTPTILAADPTLFVIKTHR